MNSWTLFFWAWWVLLGHLFVGLFFSTYLKGRTIRQFVIGTLIIPFCIHAIMVVLSFGNSALYEVIHGNQTFAETVVASPEKAFILYLELYPGFGLTASVATITGLLFYVTSADSGSLVLGNFTSQLVI